MRQILKLAMTELADTRHMLVEVSQQAPTPESSTQHPNGNYTFLNLVRCGSPVLAHVNKGFSCVNDINWGLKYLRDFSSSEALCYHSFCCQNSVTFASAQIGNQSDLDLQDDLIGHCFTDCRSLFH